MRMTQRMLSFWCIGTEEIDGYSPRDAERSMFLARRVSSRSVMLHLTRNKKRRSACKHGADFIQNTERD